MIMNTLRKHMKIILWIVVAAFVGTIFFVWGMDVGRQKDYLKQGAAAMVNDQAIPYTDFDRLYNQQSQQLYGSSATEPTREELQRLRKDLIREMIDTTLMRQQFEKLGQKIFPEDVAARIAAFPGFQKDGKFSPERYFSLLQYNRIEPQEFEAEQERSLEILKLQRWLKDSVLVSDDQLRAYFLARARQLKLRVVSFNYKDRLKGITIDETAVKEYYQKHRQEYDQPAEIRASHILLTVDPKAPEDQKRTVKLKLENLRQDLLKGADFAKLAKEQSQDPGSAAKGGDLGFFKAGEMVPAFEKAAFGLKVGEISQIVETPFGYHLIKVTERKEEKHPSLADVRTKIVDALKAEQARKQTLAQAIKFLSALKKSQNLAQAAGETGVKWVDTDWVSSDSRLPGVDKAGKVMDKAFDLPLGKPSPVISSGEAQVVVEVLAEKYRPFDEQTFQSQRDALADALKDKQADAMLTAWLDQAKRQAHITNNIEQEKWDEGAGAPESKTPTAK